MVHLRLPTAAVLAAALWFLPLSVQAQPAPAPAAAPAFPEPPPLTLDQIVARLPPAPALPSVAQGNAPPAVVTGVLSVPDVMRGSLAAQQMDRELGARRQKLNEDEQKEQQTLHDLGQQLANERAKLSPDQARARERELQDRFNESRRKFATRDRIIQDAGQFCLVQIQRVMTPVVQQVAARHSMNFVIRREQIVLNTADVDITGEVVEILNKVLPSVIVPPDGVAVLDMKPAAAASATTATPAAPQKR